MRAEALEPMVAGWFGLDFSCGKMMMNAGKNEKRGDGGRSRLKGIRGGYGGGSHVGSVQ